MNIYYETIEYVRIRTIERSVLMIFFMFYNLYVVYILLLLAFSSSLYNFGALKLLTGSVYI